MPSHANSQLCILPISELSTYHQRWTIRARVTSKSQLRTFTKGSNTGKVFSVNLLDKAGGEIKASLFNVAVDQYFEKLKIGKCYTFSRGSTKIANPQFNMCNHRYEIVFDKNAEISEVADDAQIEKVKLSLTDLRSLQSRNMPCYADLCGIVSSVGNVSSTPQQQCSEGPA